MKLEAYIFLIVSASLYTSFAQQSSNEETGIASSQGWPESQNAPILTGEEEEGRIEDEVQRRPRGKRRRRLRKRQRVHQGDEEIEDQNVENNYGERASPAEDEETIQTEGTRRRPSKRRRRPYRRQQEDGESKPQRRRRKGGRKRTRIEGVEEESHTEYITTEAQPNEGENERNEDTTSSPTKQLIQNAIIDVPQEKSTEEVNKIMLQEESPEEKINEQETRQDAINIVKTEQEDQGSLNMEKSTGFGNKIFDRRRLFSNSRRLPVTSAIIRKLNIKLTPNTTELQTTNNQNPSHSYETSSNNSNTEILQQQNKITPENNTKSLEENEEEANYPKIFFPRPFFKFQNRSRDLIEKRILTTSIPESTSISNKDPENSKEVRASKAEEFGMKIEEQEKKTDNEDDLKSNVDQNVTNDYIVELMKTQNGKEYLMKILKVRNMTLEQLLEHRERGSSQFHLSEIFTQKQSTSKATTTMTSTSTEHVMFPSDEVLNSYQTFVSDQLQHSNDNLTLREGRESRVFESMPQFTTEASTVKIENVPQPTWRVIPNPKFRPVSARGNYEEIPVAKFPSNINEIYLLDEREALIVRQRKGGESFREAFGGAFRRIPVGVKSAIIISGVILIVATFGFLSLLISCRVRQKRSLIRRTKKDMMCEHLSNDEFMTSQQSLSPVLTKSQQTYEHPHSTNQHHPHHRHYYLWRTLRKTFRYD